MKQPLAEGKGKTWELKGKESYGELLVINNGCWRHKPDIDFQFHFPATDGWDSGIAFWWLIGTGPCWCYVNIGLGNGLVLSGNKPLSEPILTQICVSTVYGVTRPQWVNTALGNCLVSNRWQALHRKSELPWCQLYNHWWHWGTVITTTSDAASEDKVGIMTTLCS